MRLLVLLLGILTIAEGSYCGENGVPFSLEILPNGAPVLGCAQPSCVAQPAEDVDDSAFQTDGAGQPDGFFRQGDRTSHGFLQTNKMRANCSSEYDQLSCPRKNQWIGGIDFIDHPRQPLLLRCCSFDGLRYSQDVGVTVINPGETVTGGEVVRQNRQISFDIIANVRKLVDDEDSRLVSYEVTVRRMNCLPDPPEIEVPLDDDVGEEVLRVLEKSSGAMPVAEEVTTEAPPRYKKLSKKTITKKTANQFVGSFGAPIFTPDGPRERHIPSPKRVLPTTAAPATVAPQTIPGAPALPTLAPFGFGQSFFFPQPQPQLQQAVQVQPQLQQSPLAQPRLPQPQPQAYGVSQASLHPLPPPNPLQFPQMFPHGGYNPFLPQPQPFGVAQQFQYGQTGQQPFNPFFHPVHITPLPGHHMFGVQQFNLPVAQQQQPQQVLAQQSVPQADTGTIAQPARSSLPVEQRPVALSQPSRVEPQLPPTNRQLGTLWQPPQFNAIDAALHNFQLQG